WEVNGRIVGNITLLTTKTRGRFLVANVAVHPDHRRRGIAQVMMQAAIERVQAQQGATIALQVVKDNAAAIQLYQNLGFFKMGNMTLWQTGSSRIRELPKPGGEIRIRPLRGGDWSAAYKLDTNCLPNDLNWPNLLPEDAYRRGVWQQVGDFVNGRQEETWIVKQPDGQIVGLGSIISDWGRAHKLKIRVQPAWQGQLEHPLFAKLIRRLRYLSPRTMVFNHPDDDLIMTQLLEKARFTRLRILTHMRLDLR
ncbi:MAG: GNAT family N-acetyltransferase, partial [Methylococcales bacterium]|nr:GNAT family N-acetyltransferase [Methylococcales bacterium]